MKREYDCNICQKEVGKYYFYSLNEFSTGFFESRFQGFSFLQELYDGSRVSIENTMYLVEELLRLPLTTLPEKLRCEPEVLAHEINFIKEIEEFQEGLANMLIVKDIPDNLDNLPSFILCPNHYDHGHVWIIDETGNMFFSPALYSTTEALLWIKSNQLIYQFKDKDIDRLKYQIYESGITTHFSLKDLGIWKADIKYQNHPN